MTELDRIFRALGDPTRRAILEKVSEAPASITRLAEPFGISVAAVVQHVQILEESGLVRTEKVGRVRTCRIDPQGLDLVQKWIANQRSTWERRLDTLGELLAEE